MKTDVMRELVRRYYATQIGGEPDSIQVDKIIRFARGLPMAVTTAVRLWVKYNVKDFEEVEAGALDELVRRLRDGVPPALVPVLNAAATLRYFNKSILREVAAQMDIDSAYDELCRFPFMKSGKEGAERVWRLHDSVREFIDFKLQVDDPDRHRELHERAEDYFKKRLGKATGEEAERLRLEGLYHRFRADEEAGIKLFQEMAEELVRYELVSRLQTLLNDVGSYPLSTRSRSWYDYYEARLIRMCGQHDLGFKKCQELNDNNQIEPRLRAYVLWNLAHMIAGNDTLGEPETAEKALSMLAESRRLLSRDDPNLLNVLGSIYDIYVFAGDLTQCLKILEEKCKLLENSNDKYSQICNYLDLESIHGILGNWKQVQHFYKCWEEALADFPDNPFIRRYIMGHSSWSLIWSGHYAEAEQRSRLGWEASCKAGGNKRKDFYSWHWAYALGKQRRYEAAQERFEESMVYVHNDFDSNWKNSMILGLWGDVLKQQGDFKIAQSYLERSLVGKRRYKDYTGIPELLVWLGELHELQQNWTLATDRHRECLGLPMTELRKFFKCAALTGLVRVKQAQGDYAAIPPLLAEAEQLAQQYEYNDHLASLRLTQGMTTDKIETNGQTTLAYFKQAMIYALRYNRFLLDEVLSGRPQGTPLRPIIPYCLERGEEGRQMLTALREWWKTGVNDIGAPRPDTISPIPEGIPLLEAERIAREREPGDGSPQKSVLEQIETVL